MRSELFKLAAILIAGLAGVTSTWANNILVAIVATLMFFIAIELQDDDEKGHNKRLTSAYNRMVTDRFDVEKSLRERLDTANEKIADQQKRLDTWLKASYAQIDKYDHCEAALAAANERAGRLEEALKDAIEHVAGSHIGHYGYHTAYCDITVRPERLTAWVEALEVPDAHRT